MPKRDYSRLPQVRIPEETRRRLDQIRAIERRPRSYGAIIAELVARRLRELDACRHTLPHWSDDASSEPTGNRVRAAAHSAAGHVAARR